MIRHVPARAIGSLGALVLAAALVLPAPRAAAEALRATEFSSQHDPRVSGIRQGQGGVRPGGGPPPGFRAAPRPPGFNPGVAPRVMGAPGPGFRAPAQPGFAGPRGQGFAAPQIVRPQGQGIVTPRQGFAGPQPGFRGPAAGFRGPVGVTGFRGGHATFIRGRHHVRRGAVVLPLVGLGLLGGLYVGSRYYTPYAYVDGPVDAECAGPTDDGWCELRLTEVPLEGGGAELQCVAYCPQ